MTNAPSRAVARSKSESWEFLKTILIAVILATLFRSFAYEPFHIPSGSMKGTLLIGDYIFVSKSPYGYSRYSFPLGLPLFEGRMLQQNPPERGDIAVFRLPRNPKIDYIKRVIGLPGDQIQVRDGVLFINGQEIKRERIEDFIDVENPSVITRVPQYIETLPNGVTYHVLDQIPRFGEVDNTEIYTVPPGHYFMMGDNRDNSVDSRFQSDVGFVPEENFVGKAKLIFFSTDGTARFWEVWKWIPSLRFDRLLHAV